MKTLISLFVALVGLPAAAHSGDSAPPGVPEYQKTYARAWSDVLNECKAVIPLRAQAQHLFLLADAQRRGDPSHIDVSRSPYTRQSGPIVAKIRALETSFKSNYSVIMGLEIQHPNLRELRAKILKNAFATEERKAAEDFITGVWVNHGMFPLNLKAAD